MRVLYFTRDYTPHDHRFLAAVAASPHEVFYLRLERRDPQRESRPLPEGVRLVKWAGGQQPFRWRSGLRLLADLRRVIRDVQPDLIHAGPIQTVALLAALSGFKPLVAMSWGYDLLQDAHKNAWLRWATRTVLRHTTVLLCDNDALADIAAGFGFPRERIVQFPWGVDLDHFSPGCNPAMRERRGWGDAIVVLHNRNWESLYGIETVIKAFSTAVQRRGDLRLLLLGSGSLAPNIRRSLQGSGTESFVHLAGQVSNQALPDYYHCADLYLSASTTDGTSVSLLEALACGLPAIVSDIPGNQQWVDESVGATFPVGDANALAEHILALAEDADRRRELGANARQRAERHADWQQSKQLLLHGYDLAVTL